MVRVKCHVWPDLDTVGNSHESLSIYIPLLTQSQEKAGRTPHPHSIILSEDLINTCSCQFYSDWRRICSSLHKATTVESIYVYINVYMHAISCIWIHLKGLWLNHERKQLIGLRRDIHITRDASEKMAATTLTPVSGCLDLPRRSQGVQNCYALPTVQRTTT